MVRVLTGLAAWAGGTALAVSLAWFGANVVVRNAGITSGMPVVGTVTPAPPASSLTPAVAVPATSPPTASPSAPVTSAATPAGAMSGTASSPAEAGSVHGYTLTGGRVTLLMTSGSVELLTAVPDAGYSVQTWSEADWLRVDFSSGPQVSSLIASWYEHAPTVTVAN